MRKTAKRRKLTSERRTTTPPRLAKAWGVSTTKVDAFIKSGELKAFNLATSRNGRPRYGINLADVEAFEKSRQVIPDGGQNTTQRLRRKHQAGVTEYF